MRAFIALAVRVGRGEAASTTARYRGSELVGQLDGGRAALLGARWRICSRSRALSSAWATTTASARKQARLVRAFIALAVRRQRRGRLHHRAVQRL